VGHSRDTGDLAGANADSGFAVFIYGITKPFLAPFTGLVGTPTSGGTILEVTTLIAMLVYALFFWVVVRVIRVVLDRPSARTFTRSVREQTSSGGVAGAGSERTTHTISKGQRTARSLEGIWVKKEHCHDNNHHRRIGDPVASGLFGPAGQL
jgi:hypothetical protein